MKPKRLSDESEITANQKLSNAIELLTDVANEVKDNRIANYARSASLTTTSLDSQALNYAATSVAQPATFGTNNNSHYVGDVVLPSSPLPFPQQKDLALQNFQWGSTHTLPQFFEAYDLGKYPVVDISETNIKTMGWEDGKTIYKESKGYLVNIFVPGVNKELIEIELKEGGYAGVAFFPPKMQIRVRKNSTDEKVYILKESKTSFAHRIVSLPADADITTITSGKMSDGVLSFTILKDEKPEQPVIQKKKVQIK